MLLGGLGLPGIAPMGLMARIGFMAGVVLMALIGNPAGGPALAAESFGSYRFEISGRAVQIPSMVVKGEDDGRDREFISLRGAAAALGGTVAALEPAGSFRLDIAGSGIGFSSDHPAIVTAGDRIVSMSQDARTVGRDLYLPLDFLTRVLDPILRSAREPGRGPSALENDARPVIRMASALNVPSLFPTVELAVAPAGSQEPTAGRADQPSGSALGASKDGPFTIVLDPGHGGDETGAAGRTGVLEKEITLDIAKRLKALLDKEPRLRVLLTRDSDALVGLDERTALANQNHADLFLSIHVNSARRHAARGAETYYLASQAKDEEIRTLAAIENNAAGVDRARLGADPGNLELVLWDLAQSQYLEQSSDLAEVIQRELNDALGVRDRGVKQAPFRVLMGATMPAVLVEVGFISNPTEEAVLKDGEYRDRIAHALSRAALAFRAGGKARIVSAPAATR